MTSPLPVGVILTISPPVLVETASELTELTLPPVKHTAETQHGSSDRFMVGAFLRRISCGSRTCSMRTRGLGRSNVLGTAASPWM